MFSNLIKHITNHKVGYGIGAGIFAFFTVAVMASPALFGVNLLGLPKIPVLTLNSPNGGGTRNPGEVILVTFRSPKVPVITKLWISPDAPSYQTRVQEVRMGTPEKNEKGQYQFAYVVPKDLAEKTKAKSDKYYFQIEINASANTAAGGWESDWSDTYVTIRKPTATEPQLKVLYPNGGETLFVGDKLIAKVEAKNIDPRVNPIELGIYKGNTGIGYNKVISDLSLKDSDSDVYTVMFDLVDPSTVGQYKTPVIGLKMLAVSSATARGANTSDLSDNVFVLNSRSSLNVISPNGGTFNEGEQMIIKFEGKGIDPRVNPIALSLASSDGLVQSIATINNLQLKDSTSDVYTYAWQVGTQGDHPAGTTYRIYAKLSFPTNGMMVSDGSDTAFMINEQTVSTSVQKVTLMVSSNVANFPFTVLNSSGSQVGEGIGNKTFQNLAPGTYTINYGNVDGYTAPAPISPNLAPGVVYNAIRNYTALAPQVLNGTLNVYTADFPGLKPNAAFGYDVTNPSTNVVIFSYTGDHNPQSFSLPAGSYGVVFKAVEGFETPATQTVQVGSNNQVTNVNGIYKAIPGTLSVSSEGNPNSATVVAGKTQVLAAKYRFTALREAFTVNKLTVINDVTGAFDTPVTTNAVMQVALKFTDANGVSQTKTASLSQGAATLSNLGLSVPKGGDAYVEIYADVSSMSAVGETLSGKMFRLGLRDAGNSIITFEAVGATSSSTVTDPVIANGSSVNSMLVRKSFPTFAKVSGLGIALINGENRLYGLTITADPAGAVGFGELNFSIANQASLSGFKFYRGSSLMSQDAIIIVKDASGQAVVNPTQSQPFTGNLNVTVRFKYEETVSAGQSQTYFLDATVTGATIDNIVETRLVNSGVSGLTGKLSDMINAAGPSWSDKSADMHTYPTVDPATGNIASGTGSADWNNWHELAGTIAPHRMTK